MNPAFVLSTSFTRTLKMFWNCTSLLFLCFYCIWCVCACVCDIFSLPVFFSSPSESWFERRSDVSLFSVHDLKKNYLPKPIFNTSFHWCSKKKEKEIISHEAEPSTCLRSLGRWREMVNEFARHLKKKEKKCQIHRLNSRARVRAGIHLNVNLDSDRQQRATRCRMSSAYVCPAPVLHLLRRAHVKDDSHSQQSVAETHGQHLRVCVRGCERAAAFECSISKSDQLYSSTMKHYVFVVQ